MFIISPILVKPHTTPNLRVLKIVRGYHTLSKAVLGIINSHDGALQFHRQLGNDYEDEPDHGGFSFSVGGLEMQKGTLTGLVEVPFYG